jgi:hypothetical protein
VNGRTSSFLGSTVTAGGSAGFAPVVSGALEAGATRWIGVLAIDQGKIERRVKLTPEEFANGRCEENVLYIVEPDRTPRAVVRRHGPRRRSSKK